MDSNVNLIYKEICIQANLNLQEVIDEDSIEDIYNKKLTFSESIIKVEQKTLQKMNQHELRYQMHRAQSMISGSKNECQICQQQFGMINRSHTCGFCQNPVCSKHSRKKRRRESDQTNQRICDSCEEDILFQFIYQEAQDEREEIEKELSSIENQQESLIEIIKQNEENYKQIRDQKNNDIIRLQSEIVRTQNIIDRVQEEIQVLRFQIQKQKDTTLETMNEAELVEQKIQSKFFLLDMKTQQSQELEMKIINYEQILIQTQPKKQTDIMGSQFEKERCTNDILQNEQNTKSQVLINSSQSLNLIGYSTVGTNLNDTINNTEQNTTRDRDNLYCSGCLRL